MAKISPQAIKQAHRSTLDEELRDALKKMDIEERGINFLLTLLRSSETIMLARRIQIAKRLLSGDTFDQIKKKLRVGLDTIRAVHAQLEEGHEDYRILVTPQVEWLLAQKKRGKSTRRKSRPPTFACNLYELCKYYPSYAGILGLLFEED